MKSLSLWARQHPRQAQAIITLSHVGLLACAFCISLALRGTFSTPSPMLAFSLAGFTALAVILYPKKREGVTRHNYRRRKLLDTLLVTFSFALAVFSFMNYGVAEPAAAQASANGAMEPHRADGSQAFLFILAFLVALGLAYLVAALACNLACSGYEALAWVVALVGWIGIIILLIVVSVRIFRKPIGKPQKTVKVNKPAPPRQSIKK